MRTKPPSEQFDEYLFFHPEDISISVPVSTSIFLQHMMALKLNNSVSLYWFYLSKCYEKRNQNLHLTKERISEMIGWGISMIQKAKQPLKAAGLIREFRAPGKGMKRRMITNVRTINTFDELKKVLKSQLWGVYTKQGLRKQPVGIATPKYIITKVININIYPDVENTHQGCVFPQKPSSQNSKPKKPPFAQRHYNLASRIRRIARDNSGGAIKQIKQSEIENAAAVLEKLERIDKYDFDSEIKPVCFWGLEHDFWSRNFMSASSLRNKLKNGESKFTTMYMQWQDDQPKKSRPVKNPFSDALMNAVQDYLGVVNGSDLKRLITGLQSIETFYNDIHPSVREGTTFGKFYGRFLYFIEEFVKFLRLQSWIEEPSVNIFSAQNKIFVKYVRDVEKQTFQRIL